MSVDAHCVGAVARTYERGDNLDGKKRSNRPLEKGLAVNEQKRESILDVNDVNLRPCARDRNTSTSHRVIPIIP